MNLVAGDYILVPHSYTEQLTPLLDKLELRQGYLVPKGSPSSSSVYDLAVTTKPDITYLSASVSLKPFLPTPAAKSRTEISGAMFGSGSSSGSGSSGASASPKGSGSNNSSKTGKTGK
jgi:hypothetical protein